MSQVYYTAPTKEIGWISTVDGTQSSILTEECNRAAWGELLYTEHMIVLLFPILVSEVPLPL